MKPPEIDLDREQARLRVISQSEVPDHVCTYCDITLNEPSPCKLRVWDFADPLSVMPQPLTNSKRRAAQKPKACDTCYMRKRQCDGKSPCSRCSRLGRSHTCRYSRSALPTAQTPDTTNEDELHYNHAVSTILKGIPQPALRVHFADASSTIRVTCNRGYASVRQLSAPFVTTLISGGW